MNNAIEIKGLSKKFTMHILNNKVIEALDDLSFNIKQGEIVGLAGKSGAGKSTLIKCIYRTCIPTAGSILYNSEKYGTVDLATADDYTILALRKEEVTYCSQFLHVIPRVTAVDVVANSLVAKGESWDNARKTTKEYLAQLGLEEELWDAYPSTFSGGEQQRINVARAIISKPKFLLIDEPTASLDQKTKDVVIGMVLDLKKLGTSVLCITHDKYTMDNIAERTIELKNGKIV